METQKTSTYQVLVDSDDTCVLSSYEPVPKDEANYQSEAALEDRLIHVLGMQGTARLPITSETELVANLRRCMEELNDVSFTDSEWDAFFHEFLANGSDGVLEKTEKFQRNWRYPLKRDDGSTKNIEIVDKDNINRNKVQVINQYVPDGGTYENRYDVTILVNGLPLVHIELKKRGGSIREAFNQIERYGRESFWAGSSLFEWVQLFVISNGTLTKYYSNTTRATHVAKQAETRGATGRRQSGSFQFTSYWADARNNRITDLEDFARTFLTKRTLLAILTRYCVLTVDGDLMVMRPYQIAATEAVLSRVRIGESNPKLLGTTAAGGYVWHTTGSGKTLTSFKCAQLASAMESVDKVLFVVDRKDLDYQTMREYEKFEKGAVNGSTSSAVLEKHLSDPSKRIHVTTIQKLNAFIREYPQHAVYQQHVVIIFDECHRSQFGDMHMAITKKFKKYHLFGFTGTPIFAANAGASRHANLTTTQQAFGDCLHKYTIVDAIRDENVLPFRVNYVNTICSKPGTKTHDVEGIDTEEALLAPARIEQVSRYVLDHFDQATKRGGKSFTIKYEDGSGRATSRSVRGFNAILATQSIPFAKAYYAKIQELQKEKRTDYRVALIYSWAANPETDDFTADEDMDTSRLSKSDREFLDSAIADYNKTFGTSFSTQGKGGKSGEGFDNYYKDLSMRMKNREVDLLIVVNMFLTGFDAKCLNTLFVDKRLKQHGLIQAFSRTNRILNSVKSFGNIICFRDLGPAVDDALALFGDKDASGTVVLKPYEKWMDDYNQAVDSLHGMIPAGQLPVGESAEKAFIKTWGHILRLRNILSAFDQFQGNDLLGTRETQDYQSVYNTLWEKSRKAKKANLESIVDDVEFEMELVKQVEVGIDYILTLVAKYHQSNCEDKEIRADINSAIAAAPTLRDKKELIDKFIDGINVTGTSREAWVAFIENERDRELDKIIADERLDKDKTVSLMRRAWDEGYVRETGTAVMEILPKGGGGSLFSKAPTGLAANLERVIDKLKAFFERFHEIVGMPGK